MFPVSSPHRLTWRDIWPRRCSESAPTVCFWWYILEKSSGSALVGTRNTQSVPEYQRQRHKGKHLHRRYRNITTKDITTRNTTEVNRSTFLMTDTCPKYPAVPLSIKGMSAAKHIRFTWFRAAGETTRFHLSIWNMAIMYQQLTAFVRGLWPRVNTSVIQSVHHQHKFSEELHVVVGAEVDTKWSCGQF